MYRNVALLCVFVLLCACGPLPQYNKSGLWGKYPENFVDTKTGFTLWMPNNMQARQGMYAYVVERQMKYCGNGSFRGVKYDKPEGDVYKQFQDGNRIYAYYYYTEDVEVGVDAPAFNLKPTQMKVDYDVIFNITVNKDGIITACKCMRLQNGTSTY